MKHGGDPIEAAVNITPRLASFQLSDSSRELFVWGLNVLLISLGVFVAVILWFRKLGCNFNFEPEREAYIRELNKLKKDREANQKRLRGLKKPPKYESYRNARDDDIEMPQNFSKKYDANSKYDAFDDSNANSTIHEDVEDSGSSSEEEQI